MKYSDAITKTMTDLSTNEQVVFLGEGLLDANPIYGTMSGVPRDKVIEMPIAENLIVGAAAGLSLKGWRPIVIFQRMDFMLCGADAIINHLGMIPKMTDVKFPVIIRAIVGSQNPNFWCGMQHTKNFTDLFEPYIYTVEFSEGSYSRAVKLDQPTLIVEHKDKYNEEL